jgi:squalene-hopene/tetraprenyl-beta-curcumene cyclase
MSVFSVVMLLQVAAASPLPPQDSTLPLDERIDRSKVTEQPPPVVASVSARPPSVVRRVSLAAAEVPCAASSWHAARASINQGLEFLRARQDAGGGWRVWKGSAGTDQRDRSLAASTAITALALKAFAQVGELPMNSPTAARARDSIRSRVGGTGRAFNPDPQGGLGNYVASAIASALASIEDPEDRVLLRSSVEWLTMHQWDQTEGVSPRMDWFGGAGYGRSGRPDLSNTQMMLDALHDAGVSADDPAVRRALVFLTRTQNLAETNAAPWASGGSRDGGFVYTPANGGESFASEAAGEGRFGEKIAVGQPRSLRSYGSMTYAGFKSMLYAGLSKDDPRVQAAFEWIRRHWTFRENPGLGAQGHFYYLHAVSRALHAAQQHTITDVQGSAHNWRDELIAALLSMQASDGSWVNSASRWDEGDSELCTIYAVLALEEAIKPAQEAAPVNSPAAP